MKTFYITCVVLIFYSYADENIFKGVTVGLEEVKSSDLTFGTVDQNMGNLKGIELNDGECKQVMIKHATVPVVMPAILPFLLSKIVKPLEMDIDDD